VTVYLEYSVAIESSLPMPIGHFLDGNTQGEVILCAIENLLIKGCDTVLQLFASVL